MKTEEEAYTLHIASCPSCKTLPNGECVGKTCMHTKPTPLLVTIPCKVHGGHEFYVAEGTWTCASECRAAWDGEDTQGTQGERQRGKDPTRSGTVSASPPKIPEPHPIGLTQPHVEADGKAVVGASPTTASDDLQARDAANVKASGKGVKKFFDALMAKDLKMKKRKMKRTRK